MIEANIGFQESSVYAAQRLSARCANAHAHKLYTRILSSSAAAQSGGRFVSRAPTALRLSLAAVRRRCQRACLTDAGHRQSARNGRRERPWGLQAVRPFCLPLQYQCLKTLCEVLIATILSCCAVLCCAALRCAALRCAVLRCAVCSEHSTPTQQSSPPLYTHTRTHARKDARTHVCVHAQALKHPTYSQRSTSLVIV
jgi:hypothetical protein